MEQSQGVELAGMFSRLNSSTVREVWIVTDVLTRMEGTLFPFANFQLKSTYGRENAHCFLDDRRPLRDRDAVR
jgi:hypothetical protein